MVEEDRNHSYDVENDNSQATAVTSAPAKTYDQNDMQRINITSCEFDEF